MISVKYTGKTKSSGCSKCGGNKGIAKVEKKTSEYLVPSKKGLQTLKVRTGQIINLPQEQAQVLLSIKESNKNVFQLIK